MPDKRLVFAAGTIAFLLFVFFSYLVHKDLLVQFDFDSTVRLQDNISRRFDLFFSYFSVLGSFEITVGILLAIVLFRRKISSVFLLFGFGGILFFELFGKIFVDHPGPPTLFARYKQLVDFPTNYIPHPTGAYPSGHSGRTIFLSLVLLFLLWNTKKPSKTMKYILTIIITVYDAVMLISRVYLGEHWLTDVIGGTLLGASIAIFCVWLLQVKLAIGKSTK